MRHDPGPDLREVEKRRHCVGEEGGRDGGRVGPGRSVRERGRGRRERERGRGGVEGKCTEGSKE